MSLEGILLRSLADEGNRDLVKEPNHTVKAPQSEGREQK